MTSRLPPCVCLVATGHLASTPRLVKNASALCDAGYRVHVVAGRHFTPVDGGDAAVLKDATWSHTLVDYRSGLGVFARKLLRGMARRKLPSDSTASVSLRLATRAHHAEVFRFARIAARWPAQLYFGQGLAGLPAAAFAAKRRRTAYGFDAEDFHDGEEIAAGVERTARRLLQARLLPGCAVLTTASPLIAKHYQQDYAVAATTLLNVFPISDGPAIPSVPGPISGSRPARFYWFSQTIGPGRGLESVVAIVGRMRTPVALELRGFVSNEYATSLRNLAAKTGFAGKLSFLPPAAPAEMARLAATADLGLSTEESIPLNRDLCLTNKIFVYLLAGLPQLLSHTTAQAALAPDLGPAALLCELDRPNDVATTLDAFFSNSSRVAASRQAAWDIARRRYCWDVEKLTFLKLVAAAFPP